MKFCVTYVYWTLLLISVISSGVLFLIVASEGVNIEDSSLNNDESYKVTNNFTNKESKDVLSERNNPFVSDVKISSSIKTDDVDNVEKKKKLVPNDFQVPLGNEEPKKVEEIEVLAESLTQQPNLSQGISESGQSVVLTLVDTAASELQSLADPKIVSEFRARSLSNNLSLSNTPIRKEEEKEKNFDSVTDTKSEIVITTERINDSVIVDNNNNNINNNNNNISITETKETKTLDDDNDAETVVIVRAEKKTVVEEIKIDDENLKIEDEILTKDELLQDVEFNQVSELNEITIKSQLVGNDDSPSVAPDGIVTPGSSDTQEDMPSFIEWSQKQLEEDEKKKTHPNVSVQTPGSPGKSVGGMKMRSKNYASPDCGAKIIAANHESQSARNVLVSTRDEYMLNKCTSRIWFIVELCEAIQAKKIELANFELFSSSPKEFSVFVNDRYPTREWSSVGHFTAKDERDIQSFVLQPQLFGKFIKIELHSHYGSEHFCPISLFRAYGTSEFEVLETETEVQTSNSEDDDNDNENGEELLEVEGGESTRNLFGSARDAVLSIVRKAAEVLVKTGDMSRNNITKIQESIRGDLFQSSFASCTTPRYAIVCKNCSDDRFARVFQLLSCRHRYLNSLLETNLIKNSLPNSHLCWAHSGKSSDEDGNSCKARDLQATFLASVLTPDYLVALCNVLAAKDGKVVLNSSDEIAPIPDNGTLKEEIPGTKEEKRDFSIDNLQPTSPCSTDINSPSSSCKPTINIQESRRDNLPKETDSISPSIVPTITKNQVPNDIITTQIKPTKTLSNEETKKESIIVPILEPSKDQIDDLKQQEIVTTTIASPTVTSPITKIQENLSIESKIDNTIHNSLGNNEGEKLDVDDKENAQKIQEIVNKSGDVKIDGQEQNKLDLGEDAKILSQEQMNFDSLLSDFKEFEGESVNNGQGGSASAAQPTASSTPQQKESVFLRLSNRIKALERNMSLSGQYLEELSRRYKKQVEEMQRSLERATLAMSEESRKGEERDLKRMEEITALREVIKSLSISVESLVYDRDSWQSKLYYLGEHVILICINVIIVSFIISYYRRTIDFDVDDDDDREINVFQENNKVTRRKPTDFLREKTVLPKKSKKRRPSEIANNIAGTYEELMIEDQRLNSRKEKKRKRKKETTFKTMNGDTKSNIVRYKEVFSGTSNNLRTFSNDVPKQFVNLNDNRSDRENYGDLINENLSGRIEILSTNEKSGGSDENSLIPNEIHKNMSSNEDEEEPVKKGLKTEIFKSKLSSPSFMKTALGSRSKRKTENWDKNKFSNSSLQITTDGHLNGSTANGYADESDRSSSATPTSEKKEKKSTGLRKMIFVISWKFNCVLVFFFGLLNISGESKFERGEDTKMENN
ncbi:SUN domain-containing ossification factor isoform X2 [Leptopilina boulardi]|uniref:SUN domain-containing ossification factor isoform X2 n=1 Tax=Leptopilina boulardi TaxID=63433 RepID=UPI0021F55FEE|nr:SUN domain-containing ossification factor isoform X2 [Leptopilina boulardi]